jgi:hypothetical protein
MRGWKDNIRMDVRELTLDCIVSGYGLVMDICEHENLGFI